jgi:hypothetical protein
MRGFLDTCAAAVPMSLAFASASLAADGKPHHIVIQVDQNDPQVMLQEQGCSEIESRHGQP